VSQCQTVVNQISVSIDSQAYNLEKIEMIRIGKLILPIVLIAFLAAMLSSCSTANQDSPLSLVDASGNHPDGWVAAHGAYAEPDGSLCMDCHGDDLAGGITGVSCSTDAVGCHAGGPAFHPADWLDKNASSGIWHGAAYINGLPINDLACWQCHEPPALDALPDLEYPEGGKCIICHFNLSGGTTPGPGFVHLDPYENHGDFAGSPEESVCVACHEINIDFGNQDSCHNCHEVPTHVVEYLDHDQDVSELDSFTALCSSCHAITGTSPNSGAPECDSCHTESSPYSGAECTSCHGDPPDKGKHNKHVDKGASCDECHQGAGSGSGLDHGYDGYVTGVDVVISDPDVTYSGGKCSGLCHIGSESEDHEDEDW
jgi:hypothetical protein